MNTVCCGNAVSVGLRIERRRVSGIDLRPSRSRHTHRGTVRRGSIRPIVTGLLEQIEGSLSGSHATVAGESTVPDGLTGSNAMSKATDFLTDASRQGAINLRRKWMKMMGMTQGEIDRHCGPETDADYAEELENYLAMIDIQEMNKRSDAR